MIKLVNSILIDNSYNKHTRVLKKKYKLNEYFKATLLFKKKDGKSYMKFNIGFNKKGDQQFDFNIDAWQQLNIIISTHFIIKWLELLLYIKYFL